MSKNFFNKFLKLFILFVVIFGVLMNGVFALKLTPIQSSSSQSISSSVTSGSFKPITITANSGYSLTYKNQQIQAITFENYAELIEYNKLYGGVIKVESNAGTRYLIEKTSACLYDKGDNSCDKNNYLLKENTLISDFFDPINDVKSNLGVFQNNPLSLSVDERNAFVSNGYTVNSWGSTVGELKTRSDNLKTAQEALSNCKVGDCKNEKDALNLAQAKYDEVNNFIIKSGDMTSVLVSMNDVDRSQFLEQYNKKSCTGWFQTLCVKLTSQSAEQVAVLDYNKKIDALNKGQIGSDGYKTVVNAVTNAQNVVNNACKDSNSEDCKSAKKDLEKAQKDQMNAYNKELATIALSSLSENLKNSLSSKCANGFTDECNSQIQTQLTLVCRDSVNNEDCAKLKLFKSQADVGYKQTKVETSLGYDILSAILNPDRNALSAAKLLGFEANYNNVPAFLKESVPSQICMAKIDGYLDKTKEGTVNGQGGVTSYGCSQEYVQVYNELTKKYEKQPPSQCLEVLSDLRAQRTQVTPDGTTSISYSYYIRGPPSTTLKYVIAISYKDGNTIKKKEIVPLTTMSGVKNGFDIVDLPLNLSLENVDENSFTINLLAIYEDRRVYQKLSYPILPISDGDVYSSPISSPAQSQTVNTNNAQSSSSVKAELSTEDLLNMI